MPKRTPDTSRDYLKRVPLPQHATSYTVIEHETVIVNALAQLKSKGFTVEQEHYRSNNKGEVAVGVYHLTYKDDPELGMMFAWANSYDKTMRFKCAVGGFVRVSKSAIIGEDFSWSRKHTGTADQEMIATITGQILNAKSYYENLLLVKDQMKATKVTRSQMSEFFGRAFFEKKLFNKEQIGIIRDEMFKPSYEYGDRDTLWGYYNYMLVALKKAHPRTWMEEHRDLHKAVCIEFGIKVAPVQTISVTPNATTATVPASVPSVKAEEQQPKKCGCGNTRDPDGFCDGSHVKPAGAPGPDILTQDPMELAKEAEEKEDSAGQEEVVNVANEESDEEQKLIDERIAAMFGKSKSVDLNLPD